MTIPRKIKIRLAENAENLNNLHPRQVSVLTIDTAMRQKFHDAANIFPGFVGGGGGGECLRAGTFLAQMNPKCPETHSELVAG